MVKLLLSANANPNIKNKHDYRPIDYAMFKKNTKLIELLTENVGE